MRRPTEIRVGEGSAMYVGTAIFAVLAVLCVVAYVKMRGRQQLWEQDEHREGR